MVCHPASVTKINFSSATPQSKVFPGRETDNIAFSNTVVTLDSWCPHMILRSKGFRTPSTRYLFESKVVRVKGVTDSGMNETPFLKACFNPPCFREKSKDISPKMMLPVTFKAQVGFPTLWPNCRLIVHMGTSEKLYSKFEGLVSARKLRSVSLAVFQPRIPSAAAFASSVRIP